MLLLSIPDPKLLADTLHFYVPVMPLLLLLLLL
jgi:hypothetical protein